MSTANAKHAEYVIDAKTRQDAGKGASRRLRRAGVIPGVVYGAGKSPKSIELDHDHILHQSEHESFYSKVLKLKIDGGAQEDVLLKALQRHPFKPKLVHVDFQRVRSDVDVKVHVPLHFIGEEKALGVKAGGLINHLMADLYISCLPKDLPESITLDISKLDLDQSLHLSEIPLPAGVQLVALMGEEPNDLPVVAIHAPREEKEEELTAAPVSAEVPTHSEEEKAKAESEEKGAEGKK